MLWFKKKEKVNKEEEIPASTGISDVEDSEASSDSENASGTEYNTESVSSPAEDAAAGGDSVNEFSSATDISAEDGPGADGQTLVEKGSGEAATENSASDADTEKTPVKTGFFAKLKQGLKRTRDNFVYNLDVVFKGAEEIDDAFYDDLE